MLRFFEDIEREQYSVTMSSKKRNIRSRVVGVYRDAKKLHGQKGKLASNDL